MITFLAIILVILGVAVIITVIKPWTDAKIERPELYRTIQASFFWLIVSAILTYIFGWSNVEFVNQMGMMRYLYSTYCGMTAILSLVSWVHFSFRYPWLV